MSKDMGVAVVTAPLTSKRDLLLQLAERCEREKPSRELDCRMQAALDPMAEDRIRHPSATFNFTGIHTEEPGCVWNYAVPQYTASLDAAVTLVPEDYSYELTFSAAGDGAMRRARLWDWRRGPLMIDPTNERSATAKTLPLAVCAAALRARASESPADERDGRGSPERARSTPKTQGERTGG